MAQFGELITWHEITGSQPTVDLVHQHLAPYGLQEVLLGLARLSAFLSTWQNKPDAAREQDAVRQTLPTYYSKIQPLYAATPSRFSFSRISLLFVAKQALIACERNGHKVTDSHDIEQVVACCLMANDLALGRQPLPEDAKIDRAANLLSFSNYVPQGTESIDIARNLLLIYEIAPQLSCRSDYRNLAEEFTQAAHLTPQVFCELTFCAAIKFIQNVDEQRHPGGLILDREYFRHTQIPPVQLETPRAHHHN